MGCCNSKKEMDHTGATGNVITAARNTQEFKDQQADEAAQALGAHSGLSSRVQLSISCANLAKLDKTSKSDPLALMYLRTGQQTQWKEIGRTEVIANTQDPHFVTKLHLNYHFEEVQYVKFEVWDVDADFSSADSSTVNLAGADFQGRAEVVVSQMVGVDGKGHWTAPLLESQTAKNKASSEAPTITVTAEEAVNVNSLVKLTLHGENLASMDTFSKSDPFVQISRLNEDGSWTPCFKTERKKDTSRPRWNMINSSVQQLANGDVYRPLRFDCFDYNRNGTHDLIGSCEISLSDAVTMAERAQQQGGGSPPMLPLINPEKKSKAGYTDSGKLVFDQCILEYHPSFLEYIRGGTEISFIVAIDFTASNGEIMSPDSLHYVDPSGQRLNQYAQAILSVGQVVEFYDTDKLFPVYGFGAKTAPGQPSNHCFAVNFNEQSPDHHEQAGVAGILSSYYSALQKITLSGPTLFTNIISQASALAASTAGGSKYYILLILTDGIINDMANTIETIIAASNLPISVLVVGVGDADFEQMHILDSDGKRLKSQTSGREAERDIVQFVEISKYINPGQGVCDQYALARELLAEIPAQLLSYMDSHSLTPQQINVQMQG